MTPRSSISQASIDPADYLAMLLSTLDANDDPNKKRSGTDQSATSLSLHKASLLSDVYQAEPVVLISRSSTENIDFSRQFADMRTCVMTAVNELNDEV